jgi:hypothetical protein
MSKTFVSAEYYSAMGAQAAQADKEFYDDKQKAKAKASAVYSQRRLIHFKDAFIDGYVKAVKGAGTWAE